MSLSVIHVHVPSSPKGLCLMHHFVCDTDYHYVHVSKLWFLLFQWKIMIMFLFTVVHVSPIDIAPLAQVIKSGVYDLTEGLKGVNFCGILFSLSVFLWELIFADRGQSEKLEPTNFSIYMVQCMLLTTCLNLLSL